MTRLQALFWGMKSLRIGDRGCVSGIPCRWCHPRETENRLTFQAISSSLSFVLGCGFGGDRRSQVRSVTRFSDAPP